MPVAGPRSGLWRELASRYTEAKRVVANKNLGPLISSRDDALHPLHPLRALWPGNRGHHGTRHGGSRRACRDPFICRQDSGFRIVGQHDRSLSGRGADVSKPFRYWARTWELSRRRSVSPHCGLGSNLMVQVKRNRVMRVLPRENEEINECWISDKDRFSYEGLNSEERLTKPMIRRDGQWQECRLANRARICCQWIEGGQRKTRCSAYRRVASPHSTLGRTLFIAKARSWTG